MGKLHKIKRTIKKIIDTEDFGTFYPKFGTIYKYFSYKKNSNFEEDPVNYKDPFLSYSGSRSHHKFIDKWISIYFRGLGLTDEDPNAKGSKKAEAGNSARRQRKSAPPEVDIRISIKDDVYIAPTSLNPEVQDRIFKEIEKINANKAKKRLEVVGIKLRKNSIEFENVYGQTVKILSGKK